MLPHATDFTILIKFQLMAVLISYIMDLLQMDCLREPFFDHDDRHRHLAVRILMTTSK